MALITPQTLVKRLEGQLTPEALAALRALQRLTEEASLDLYLVGGAVRDLVLGRPNFDLDLALEAGVAPIAEALASATGGRAVLHPRFGTARVSGPAFHLDLARARRETYAHPGALPAVQPATLAGDLARRDFSINAMALRLSGPPRFIDPHQGLDDLMARDVRVLHERSFQDDATRMLRAVRYAARLGFGLQSQTEAWLRRDLPYLNPVSGPRLRRELHLMFLEAAAVDAALLAERLGLLRAVHETLSLPDDVAGHWRDALEGPHQAPLDELGFCVLARDADEAAVASLSARLHLAGRFETALSDSVRLRAQSSKLAAMRHNPVAAVEMLDLHVPSAIWAAGVLAGHITAETCDAYLREWRRVRPHLRGHDLMALGITPGVAVGDALRALRSARLAGSVTTREDEVGVIHAMVQGKAG